MHWRNHNRRIQEARRERPALERRFTPISVDEPSPDEAILILEGGVAPYAEHHRVDYHLDAIHAAVRLTHQFVSERKLPDQAFAALDLAGSRARRRGRDLVDLLEVAKVVHEWTQVPLERLADVDADRFANAEETLGRTFIGHKSVIKSVTKALKRGLRICYPSTDRELSLSRTPASERLSSSKYSLSSSSGVRMRSFDST